MSGTTDEQWLTQLSAAYRALSELFPLAPAGAWRPITLQGGATAYIARKLGCKASHASDLMRMLVGLGLLHTQASGSRVRLGGSVDSNAALSEIAAYKERRAAYNKQRRGRK